MKKPKVLLLDEHTAALDPKTAAKVMEISDRIIAENNLTALMVTHNMKDAIAHGNRLIMMKMCIRDSLRTGERNGYCREII